MSDRAYLGPNRVIPDGLYVCLDKLKNFDFGKDVHMEGSPSQLFIDNRTLFFLVYIDNIFIIGTSITFLTHSIGVLT